MSSIGRIVSALSLGALLLSGCEKPASPPPAPLAVLVREVGAEGATPIQVYTGELRARYETDLAFRVGGKLVARPVDVGDTVHRGDVLARLDAADLRLSAQAARDQLAAAQAELSLAQAELERARQLVAQKFISASVLDSRQTAMEAAEARVRQAGAQSALSANQADYSTLRAEHEAVVLAVRAELGEVVAAGQAVLRVARTDEREVVIHVPEGRIGEVAVGMGALVRPLADQQRTYRAMVREVAAAADPATRTFELRLLVPDADQHLPLGASVLAGFVGTAGSGTLLPLPAVAQLDGRSVVWTVDADGRVAPQEVQLLELREDGALVGPGLSPGARIVVAGTHRLTPGQRVRAVAEQAPVTLDAQR